MQINETLPTFPSIYRAIVVSSTDPSNSGRIKTVCPQVSGTTELMWASPVNPGEPIPLVNTVVWVFFSGGDLTKPLYFSNTVTAPPTPPEMVVILDWQTPTLVSGYTNNGNNNGTVKYRVVDFLGSYQLQWMGGLSLTYPSGTIANGGQPFSAALSMLAWPSSLRSVTAACSTASSSFSSLKFDTSTAGICSIVGTNSSTVQPPWISLNGLNYFL